jgi:glycosyltransferase involved in cell wall biosynthesis
MNLLFVHQAFPAQFGALASGLIQRGHTVQAIASQALPGQLAMWPHLAACQVHIYDAPQSEQIADGVCDPVLEASLIRARRVAETAQRLTAGGWIPDVVVFHSGWGEGLYLRDLWPQALLIAYPELYGSPTLLTFRDPDALPATEARLQLLRRQNLMALAALADADVAIVPTLYQRDSFPGPWRHRLHVAHEGIDIHSCYPDPDRRLRLTADLELCHGDPVLTFVSRSLEPLRGFGRFLRALPDVLEANPDLQVVVVGRDRPSYCPPSPHPGGYRAALLEQLGDRLDLNRVHCLGVVGRDQLTALFQVSAVHAYLSHPYVLSWSLLEAMACGVPIVASDTPPVREVIRDGHNGLLAPLDDLSAIASALNRVLADRSGHAHLGQAARRTVQQRYAREHCVDTLCNWILSCHLLRSGR